jgi:hypothetical protein
MIELTQRWLAPLTLFLFMSISLGVTVNAEPLKHRSEKWLAFSDTHLGISFQYLSRYKVWVSKNEVFLDNSLPPKSFHEVSNVSDRVDLLMNGRRLNEAGKYLLHFTVGQGSFSQANQDLGIFEKSGQSWRLKLGRFNNPPAKKIHTPQWIGYESGILCSTEDEETGFHAAGGWCYWSLISDGTRFLLVDTQAMNPQQETQVHAMVKSVKFLNNRKPRTNAS